METTRERKIEIYKKYLKYLLNHIKYVRRKCFSMWLYWQWLVHDWDKFLPTMFIDYAEHFYGDERSLDRSWHIHQKYQKHHRQYWVLIEDSGNIKPLVMQEKYIKEMLCDWWWVWMTFLHDEEGAQEKYNIFDRWEVWNWYYKNKDKMILSFQTKSYIEDFLDEKLYEAKVSLLYDGCSWRDNIWQILQLEWLYENPIMLEKISSKK